MPAPVEGPVTRGGHPVWWVSSGGIEVRFVGRGPGGTRTDILGRLEEGAPLVAEAKQVHSGTVLPAREGFSGRGDALWTARPGLALSVITADCVPVLLAASEAEGGRVAAVHAGWRGITAGVVEGALEALGAPPETLAAWIGPSIGVCCYEVGGDVADEVAAASDPSVAIPGHRTPRGRPHLDLAGAVRHQLVRAGVPAPRVLLRCTRCDAERLWSYRREGKGVGRNVAFIWRKETP